MAHVRYWAAARELAGAVVEQVDGATLDEVLTAVGEAHGPRMVALVGRSVVLVDGAAVPRAASLELAASAEVEILPPYAGGSA